MHGVPSSPEKKGSQKSEIAQEKVNGYDTIIELLTVYSTFSPSCDRYSKMILPLHILITATIIAVAVKSRLYSAAFTTNRRYYNVVSQSSPQTKSYFRLDDNYASQSAATSSDVTSGRVSCKVSRILPHTSPKEAQQAWLEHHWRRGGGLPIIISIKKTSSIHPQDVDDFGNAAANMERLILPVGLKETILKSGLEEDDDTTITIRYTVSDPGYLFGQHIIPGSHQAQVKFEPLPTGGCRMIWKVDFETQQLQSLYQQMTDFSINTAATTIEEAVAEPRLFTLTTTLEGTDDPNSACREWINFFWGQGGGLLLPPTIPYGDKVSGMPESSSARQSLLRIPPFLKDTITSVSWADPTEKQQEYAEVCYQIENPGWATFPFLFHTHTARVRFRRLPASTLGAVAMEWNIEIRPYRIASSLVETLIAMTASTITRNLKIRLSEPDAVVNLGLPRGYGGHKWGSVPKETWLGGVLQAHLSDRRSTLKQTLTLFQPWTWGRSGRGDTNDDVHYSWSDGAMEA